MQVAISFYGFNFNKNPSADSPSEQVWKESAEGGRGGGGRSTVNIQVALDACNQGVIEFCIMLFSRSYFHCYEENCFHQNNCRTLISPFCGATDTSLLDFWWCLLWVSKPGWIPCLRTFWPGCNSWRPLLLNGKLWIMSSGYGLFFPSVTVRRDYNCHIIHVLYQL